MALPSTLSGFVGWLVGTLIVVAVGIFILSRINPVWRLIVPAQGA